MNGMHPQLLIWLLAILLTITIGNAPNVVTHGKKHQKQFVIEPTLARNAVTKNGKKMQWYILMNTIESYKNKKRQVRNDLPFFFCT